MDEFEYRIIEMHDNGNQSLTFSAIIVNDKEFIGIIFDYTDVTFSVEDDHPDNIAVRFSSSYRSANELNEVKETDAQIERIRDMSLKLLSQILSSFINPVDISGEIET